MEENSRHEVPLQAQKMEVLGRLAGAVIHDLNNLLTVIQLNAGLISSGELGGEEVISSAEKIDEASSRAAELTRKVLNFARGRPGEATENVLLQELVIGLNRLLEPLIAKRANIHISHDSRDLWVQGNRGAIEQAVMNLVLNAVDAMPAGGNVTISFGERNAEPGAPRSNYAGIFVIDDGDGIPETDQKRVFEPFFTTKEYGTGMGLAIVQRIARLHRGVVEFSSMPGKGTEFRMWLPESPSPNSPVEPASENAVKVSSRTVLLVEDDPGILALAKYLLEAQGLRVLSATTGEDALELWEKHRDEIDLFFTDIVLPGELSGRDVALKILASDPALPVLYTSGYGSMGNEQAYLTEKNFLAKPFPPVALRRAVMRALAGG